MSDLPAPGENPTAPALLWAVAGAASLGAALVHAAAAGSHATDRQLTVIFAVTALAQGAWAAWALGRRAGRATAVTGILLQGFALGVLLLAWTTGVGVVEGLADRQDPGVQDGVTAVLEVIALVASVALTVRPLTSMSRTRRASVPAFAAVLLLTAAVPGMAAPHAHRGAGAEPENLAVGHEHDESEGHVDPVALPAVAGVSAEEEERARDLIRRTREGLARYSDPAAAQAAGFISIGDGFTGFEHFVHYGYISNANVLDADEPESLVYRVATDGTRELASAMYILPTGSTMEDVPDVAGAMTPWHDHRNLCWGPDGRLAGILVDGTCRPGGEFRVTPPMLHVWVIDHVCGPFAGIEGGQTPQTPEECPAHGH